MTRLLDTGVAQQPRCGILEVEFAMRELKSAAFQDAQLGFRCFLVLSEPLALVTVRLISTDRDTETFCTRCGCDQQRPTLEM